ncbi:MAG: hypothetical protein GY810_23350 [Aureispira sp.]|nr:hypothetical protein [Aureispira sp.]
MKNLYIFIIGISCLFFSSNALGQVEARLHQVFDAKAKVVNLQIDEDRFEVNLKETYSTVMIVEVIIAIDLVDPNQMEEIINSGRYHVDYALKDGVATFSTKKDLEPIIIEGKEAEEHIIYNVSIPEYIEIE